MRMAIFCISHSSIFPLTAGAQRLRLIESEFVNQLPHQLVHGDFWDNNVLFRNDKIMLRACLILRVFALSLGARAASPRKPWRV